MANSSQRMNPFLGSTNISYGFYNQLHTSSVSIHYTDGQLITPWPILLFSTAISSILAAANYLSAGFSMQKAEYGIHPPHSNFKKVLAFGGLSIITIRLSGLILLAIKGSSSRPSPSSIVLFMISILPYTGNVVLPKLLQFTAYIEFVACFGVMVWLFFHGGSTVNQGQYLPNAFGYAQVVISGGNCPSLLQYSTCSNLGGVSYRGCQNSTTPDASVHIKFLNITEDIFEGFGVFAVGLGIYAFTSAIIYNRLGLVKDSSQQGVSAKRLSPEVQAWKGYQGLIWLLCVVVGIVLFIVVPEHMKAQIWPDTYSILDSYGPYKSFLYSDNFTSLTDWTDCFDIKPPNSISGFIDVWWASEKSKGLRILSGV
jgi:hypothetical protein